MSRLAISTNRPFAAVARTVASTKPSFVRLLSTTSTPPAAGIREDLVCEIRTARVVDVFTPSFAQHRAFVGAGGGEDRRPALLRQLDRGQTDTAAGGMHEYAVTRPELCRVEREQRGEHRGGHARGRRLTDPLRHRRDQLNRHIDAAGHRSHHYAENPLPDLEFGYPGTHLRDDAGVVATDRARIARVEAEHIEHVAEVETGGRLPGPAPGPSPARGTCVSVRRRLSIKPRSVGART